MGSASHPTTQWTLLGTYVALDSTQKQVFTLPNKQWVRFIKLIWTSHYGDEYYCTLTYLRVYGTTMLETFHQEMQQSEVDVQEITQTIMQAKPGKNAKTEMDEITHGQTIATPPVSHAVEASPATIEVEVSEPVPTLLSVKPHDPALPSPPAPIVDEPGAASPLVPPHAASDQARTDELTTAMPRGLLDVPSIVDEVAPAEADVANPTNSPNAPLSAISPDPIPGDSDSDFPRGLLSPSDDSASLASPTAPSTLHDAAIVDTTTDQLAASAGVEAHEAVLSTHALDMPHQQQQTATDTTEQPPNGTQSSVAAPPVAAEQIPLAALITPAQPTPTTVESSAAPSASSSVPELIPIIPSVAAPSVPHAAPAVPTTDPAVVVAATGSPVVSRDAPFPSLPSLRSGSDRASAGSSSGSGQQSIFKSLTNRIKQLEIEQAMIHNYVSELADQYNRDMANMRARMESMGHDMQAHRDKMEMQWKDGWAMLNSTSAALSADNHRVLHSVKAQMDRAQETTETVELVIQAQLWLSGLLFVAYFLGRWLLSLVRYTRKSVMRLCCWLRRRKRLTRHVHSKSSPSLMLTDAQFAQLQGETNDSSGNTKQQRQPRRSPTQHPRGPHRDHSRTMSMQPAMRSRTHTEQERPATEPFDPRAAASVHAAAPALASSLSPSHLAALNPRRAHAVSTELVFTPLGPPALSVSPRSRLCLDPAPDVGASASSLPSSSSSSSSSSSRLPPCVPRPSLVPPCVEEESEPAGSAPPRQRSSPVPPLPLPLAVSEAAAAIADGSPPPSQPAESTTRRFSLSLPRWISSPNSRDSTGAATAAAALPRVPDAGSSSAASPFPSSVSSSVLGAVSPLASRRSLLGSLVHRLSGRDDSDGTSPAPTPLHPTPRADSTVTPAAPSAASSVAARGVSAAVSSPSPSLRSPQALQAQHRSILRKCNDNHSPNGAVSFAAQTAAAGQHTPAQAAEEVETEGEDEEAQEGPGAEDRKSRTNTTSY